MGEISAMMMSSVFVCFFIAFSSSLIAVIGIVTVTLEAETTKKLQST